MLDNARKKQIIWVSAPAGSGKTTLIASWLDAKKLPCIWYQVDEGDSDIASLFYYMGLAAKNAKPKSKKTLPLLTPEYLPSIPTFTKRYFEELYAMVGKPFAIVLDNYQDVPVHSAFHEAIKTAASIIPKGITIIAVSRTEPQPLFIGSDAAVSLQLIGWNDVRFSFDESQMLIETQGKRICDSGTLLRLYTKTDGWVAGLIMICESIKSSGVEPQRLAGLASGEIFDYFASELLYKTDGETRDFLLKTSLLPRINARIAERITGNKTAEQILARFNRSHFFTQKHADTAHIYQYHPLFREFLVSQAKQIFSPDSIAGLRHEAALLLEKSGHVEEAAGLFIEASDWDGLTQLILKNARSMIEQGRSRTLEEWLNAVPTDVSEKTSWLLYWLGMCRLSYNPAEARGCFEKSFKLFEKDRDLSGLYLSWASIVDTFVFEWGDFKPLDHWIAVMDGLFSDNPNLPSPEIEMRAAAGMLSALTNRQPQRSDLSRWAEKVQDIIVRSHDVQLRMALGNQLIFYYLWVGDFSRIDALIAELSPSKGLKGYAPLARQNWHVMEAMHSWLAADWKTCLDTIDAGLKNAGDTGVHLLDLYLLAQGVYGGLSLGDPSTAVSCLQKMALTNSQRLGDKALYHYQASSVTWYQRDFKRSEEHGRHAIRITEEMGWPFPHVLCLIELAVTLFDNGNHDEAYDCLSKALAICSGTMIGLEFLACMRGAMFSFDRGRDKEGFGFLKRGLALGAGYGFLNMPRWDSDRVSRLCAIALENGIEVEYARKLIRKRNLMPPDINVSESWPYPLKIYTLGRFEIIKDGEPVSFSGKVQKKPLEMLKALISFGGKNVSQDRLTDALWPESDGDMAKRSFDTTLHRLRKALGGDEALQLQDGRLTLDAKYCWVDIWAFEHICRKAETLSKSGGNDSQEHLRMIDKALDIYKGRFLSGDSVYTWALPAMERMRSRFLRLTLSAGMAYEQRQEWEKAAEYFQKGLETDEVAEEFYQHLMLCKYRLGQRAEALRTYDLCRSMLSHYLGIEPSEKTQEIYAVIRQGK
jgi:DNA-binding SARP family transcriptional activator